MSHGDDTFKLVVAAGCRSFIAKFINTIFKCKPISTVGAEQVCAAIENYYCSLFCYDNNIASWNYEWSHHFIIVLFQ